MHTFGDMSVKPTSSGVSDLILSRVFASAGRFQVRPKSAEEKVGAAVDRFLPIRRMDASSLPAVPGPVVNLDLTNISVEPAMGTGFLSKGMQAFRDAGLDLKPTGKRLKLTPLLNDTQVTLSNRFRTPTSFSVQYPDEQGQMQTLGFATGHDGLDVTRSNPAGDATVKVPVSGKAMVLQDYDKELMEPMGIKPEEYSTAVAIWDPVSHLVTVSLHVKPSEELLKATSEGRLLDVQRGSTMGRLAQITDDPNDAPLESMRHSHVMVFDAGDPEKLKAVNGARFMAQYVDRVKPQVLGVSLVGDDGKPTQKLISGKRDLLIDIADKDGTKLNPGSWNLEPSRIGYEVVGTVKGREVLLKKLPMSDLDGLFDEKLNPNGWDDSSATPRLIDVASSLRDSAVDDPKGAGQKSDELNPNRTFKYAVTNLANDKQGTHLLADDQGFVEIPDSVEHVKVRVTVEDVRGNRTNKTFELGR